MYSPDSLAILFLSGGLAMALSFVHIARDQTFSFENYLFGSILTLSHVDVWSILFVSVCVGLVLFFL
jgi:ABC-type Mn2+/Zn2+ transport system permease subunit